MNSRYIPSSSTMAYYLLEDVNDASGNGMTLTNTNSVGFVAGLMNNAADFGSANTNKTLQTSNTLGIDGGVCTISFWLKMRALGSGQSLVKLMNNTSKVFFLIDFNATNINFQRVKFGGATQNCIETVTLDTVLWHNIVLTYDGTTLRGYRNGILVGSVAASGNGSSATANGFFLASNENVNQFASCYLDEVIVENVAWNANQVAAHYAGSASMFNMF